MRTKLITLSITTVTHNNELQSLQSLQYCVHLACPRARKATVSLCGHSLSIPMTGLTTENLLPTALTWSG